jgi:Cu+-exporting ATPase
MFKDPICGMMVDEKRAQFVSKHDGKTFYFCSAHCKQTFDANPHSYGHAT